MPNIDPTRCTLCGDCISVCVRRILRLDIHGLEISDPEMCIDCGHCKAVCPADALGFGELDQDFVALDEDGPLPAPDDFLWILRRRRSLRVYQDRPVEREKMAMIVQAGRYAATGSNRQGCHFVLASGRPFLDKVRTSAIANLEQQGRRIEEALERHRCSQKDLPPEVAARKHLPGIWTRIGREWRKGVDQLLYNAPAVVLIQTRGGYSTTPEMDAGIASAQMILMAETLGLGTCYNAFLVWALSDSPELRSLMQLADGYRTIAAFTVGYPDVTYRRLVGRRQAQVSWVGDW